MPSNMIFSVAVPAFALLQVASAHFSVSVPPWRGSSFEDGASQWIWPCANVSQTESANNRTLWPLTGGSVNMSVSHEWAFTYINVGFGNTWVGSVNASLVDNFNQTGKGAFCIREVGRDILAPLNITDGTNATLQFIQISHSGSALYNCADITFSSTAQLLSESDCKNSTGVGGVAIANVDGSSSPTPSASGTSSPTGSAGASSSSGAAVGLSTSNGLMAVVGAAALALGL